MLSLLVEDADVTEPLLLASILLLQTKQPKQKSSHLPKKYGFKFHFEWLFYFSDLRNTPHTHTQEAYTIHLISTRLHTGATTPFQN